MSSVDRLSEILSKLPGIGLRQSRRLAYFFIDADPEFRRRFTEEVLRVPDSLSQCGSCYRYFEQNAGRDTACILCKDGGALPEYLMVVEKDIDLENISRSGSYNGKYFVLGGLLPIVEKRRKSVVRTRELLRAVENNPHLKEIIIALNANPDGDNTTLHLAELLTPSAKKRNIKISRLGRGLSTGTELEYSDAETIKEAFENRK